MTADLLPGDFPEQARALELPEEITLSPHLSQNEAARILGMPIETVQQLAREGKLGPVGHPRLPGVLRRIEVERFSGRAISPEKEARYAQLYKDE